MLHLPGFLKVQVVYCIFVTNPKSQKQMLKSWFIPFQPSVWLYLMILFFFLSLTILAKLQVINGCLNDAAESLPYLCNELINCYFREQLRSILMKLSIQPSPADLLKDECKLTASDRISVKFLQLSSKLSRNPLDEVFHALGGEGNVAEVSQTISWLKE
jgi:hypothetical protein